MSELHQKLVDLYAGRELPAEVEHDLEAAAASDPAIASEMAELRLLVDTLHEISAPRFSEADHDRILHKIQSRGAMIPAAKSNAAYWQYHLPIQS